MSVLSRREGNISFIRIIYGPMENHRAFLFDSVIRPKGETKMEKWEKYTDCRIFAFWDDIDDIDQKWVIKGIENLFICFRGTDPGFPVDPSAYGREDAKKLEIDLRIAFPKHSKIEVEPF